ncbi:MAG: lipid A 3-O-deacylase [Bacteroidia bacterium]
MAILKSFYIGVDEKRKLRYSSSFNIGILGPAAKGKQIQRDIHQLIDDRSPNGWRNQIENHLVINYGIDVEKEIFLYSNLFRANVSVFGKIGTLFTQVSGGCILTFGRINSPFSSATNNDGFLLYGYVQPMASAVGYDATLQGGLLGDSSPYTISSSNVNRITTQFNYGLVLQTGKLYLEYSRATISKPEFDSCFEFRTLVNSEFRVKIAKTGRALSSNFYDENRFSKV